MCRDLSQNSAALTTRCPFPHMSPSGQKVQIEAGEHSSLANNRQDNFEQFDKRQIVAPLPY